MQKKPSKRRIIFEPSGRTLYALSETPLLEVSARAGFFLETPCGGKGTCGKCRIRIVMGAPPPTPAECEHFSEKELENGYRLACQCRVVNDCTVELNHSSMLRQKTKILASANGRGITGNPVLTKRYVNLSPTDNEENEADLVRIEGAIGKITPGLNALRAIPGTLRKGKFAGTAVLHGSRMLDFEPGDTTDQCFGIAFDLGTTTLVGTLLDVSRQREIAVFAEMNPQVSYGDDVISRIELSGKTPESVIGMQKAVVESLNKIIDKLIDSAGIIRRNIYEATLAGNTTMQHLFCGVSPASLGVIPFSPAFVRAMVFESHKLNLNIHPAGRVYVLPTVGGFVGGDTVAGILANSLMDVSEPTLMIDIGTNGEIVLASEGNLTATSTAAGPAFEGARISAGMRAAEGAVEKVILKNGDFVLNTIGNVSPVGICGTGLIDVAAELLRLGILDTTGRMLPPEEIPQGVTASIRSRLVNEEGNAGLLLARAEETATGEPLTLWQRDIRELQLAVGAIRAGTKIMLQRSGVEPDNLGKILVAGGFGNFIRTDNARRIGLLPNVAREKITFVGNSSSHGAKAVLLSKELRDTAQRIASKTKHVDLSNSPDFQTEFGNAMIFPGK